MGLWSVLVSCLAVLSTCTANAKEREDGILYDHTAIGLRPWYDPSLMRNNDYPNLAPHDLVQTWRWVGLQQPGEYTAIKIVCSKIFIPKVNLIQFWSLLLPFIF